ncbi:hypothetical protein ACWT_4831 [Actinoplanes sp. SE50]|uniref:DUF72 domain-containing protein n=1 Tax=unclassified Actinoplanes TaxID=2626549 RepID=UPI00023EC4B4|nr:MULTISPECIES: DUF72 domain-containing protein [unclassified Actinoplanes]AEV85850.1 hypothetical protein ACPL_4961 [Actinoplanes sp. SE50/110]ATO84246.1 hypothetical protein ACWT_4831 [Actinoplanes sp. SE50]SLM01656.1 hypothetical protein ACSP50_4892 [Actinoplanes sp. SE50/110]
MAGVRVGLCGASMALASYAQRFPVLEVQQTFYEPPRESTLRRWRDTVPGEFEFVVKAWQLITHEARSATYRRLRTPLSEAERAEVGGFRWTPVVARAWDTTVRCASLLRAGAILLQCPASFRPTEPAVTRLREFLARAPRPDGVRLLWEPRGPWPDDLVRDICAAGDLTHAADPFLRPSLTPTAYYRLHGVTGARHVHTDDELARLAAMVDGGPAYVMFNNLARADDARRFRRLVAGDAQHTG